MRYRTLEMAFLLILATSSITIPFWGIVYLLSGFNILTWSGDKVRYYAKRAAAEGSK